MIRKIINSKGFYIVLSILLAVLFWVYVDMGSTAEDTQTISGIPIVFDGEETLENRGLMIVHDSTLETVTLRLRGKRSVISTLNKDNVVITVKTSQITGPGQQNLEYTITYPSSILSGSVTVVSRSLDTIPVRVEAEASVTVPVRTELTGSIADGYYGGEIVCSPETVTITGQQDVVSQISYARVSIEGESLTESVSSDYPYELYDVSGNRIESTEISRSSETVAVSMLVEPLKEVPLTLTVQAGGGATEDDITYEIEPKTITVAGDSALLNELDQIDLGTLDLSQVLVSPDVLTMNINLPDGVVSVSGEVAATVTVTIQGLATKALDVSNIVVLHAPEGYAPRMVTQSLNVTLRGPQESLNQVTADNVTIYVDLADWDASAGSTGTITWSAKIMVSGFTDVGAVGDYSAVLTIN
jgi:YbbR domain-containing protein